MPSQLAKNYLKPFLKNENCENELKKFETSQFKKIWLIFFLNWNFGLAVRTHDVNFKNLLENLIFLKLNKAQKEINSALFLPKTVSVWDKNQDVN